MKLIVGLGNPGEKYTGTRHNVGFRAVAAMAEEFGIRSKKSFKCNALVGKGKIAGYNTIIAQPLTYMNRSGRAVEIIIDHYSMKVEDIIVIYDDLDLPPGKLRIKTTGSSGAHKGLKSVLNHLETQKVPRIRIGIGHPLDGKTKNYVLGTFNSREEKLIKETIENTVQAVTVIYKDGFQTAMNKFN